MANKRYQLEQPPGKTKEDQARWGATQRVLDRIGPDIEAASAYDAAVAADWNNDPPTSVQDALDRIAAALGPIT